MFLPKRTRSRVSVRPSLMRVETSAIGIDQHLRRFTSNSKPTDRRVRRLRAYQLSSDKITRASCHSFNVTPVLVTRHAVLPFVLRLKITAAAALGLLNTTSSVNSYLS